MNNQNNSQTPGYAYVFAIGDLADNRLNNVMKFLTSMTRSA